MSGKKLVAKACEVPGSLRGNGSTCQWGTY